MSNVSVQDIAVSEHSILAREAEKAMSFQKVELKEGRNSVINQAQFFLAVADNMKQTFHCDIKQSKT